MLVAEESWLTRRRKIECNAPAGLEMGGLVGVGEEMGMAKLKRTICWEQEMVVEVEWRMRVSCYR